MSKDALINAIYIIVLTVSIKGFVNITEIIRGTGVRIEYAVKVRVNLYSDIKSDTS